MSVARRRVIPETEALIRILSGHRSPQSTQIYSKVAVESLRQVALGDGEEVFNE